MFQQYPPGTQENYNSFSSRNHITEKGKEPEFPEGAGGGKGEPGVPPKMFPIRRVCVLLLNIELSNDEPLAILNFS